MATFWATFSTVQNRATTGGTVSIMKGNGAEGLTPITTSGTSQIVQRASADWAAPGDGFVTMRSDAAAWVQISTAPTAAAGAAFYLAANERVNLSVSPGEKIAVITG